jgi:hypothetical protein
VERGTDFEAKLDYVNCYLHCTYFLLAIITKDARSEESIAVKVRKRRKPYLSPTINPA